MWSGQSLNWNDAMIISFRAKACYQSSCISLAVIKAIISSPWNSMSLCASKGFPFARCLNVVCKHLVEISPRTKDPPLIASPHFAQKNTNTHTKEIHVDIPNRIRMHDAVLEYTSLPAGELCLASRFTVKWSLNLYRHWGSVQTVRPIGGVEV